MKNNIIYMLSFLIFFSCQSMTHKDANQKEKLENQIIFKTAHQLKKEKNLIPIGFGGSDIEGQEFLEISFDYFEPLCIEKARELVVYSTQVFLNNLSKNENLNKLIKKPYVIENIQIVIYCFNSDYSTPIPPNLSLVKLIRNNISYYYEPDNFEKIYEETYEEAVEKLKKEKLKPFNTTVE